MTPRKNHPGGIPAKAILMSAVLLVFGITAQAQNEANNWIFGNAAGIKFTGGSPAGFSFTPNPNYNTQEGCSSISDQIGNLLFYTDGSIVWNKNHTQMPAFTSGAHLMGDSSATQSALIVPWPQSGCRMYYIFTVDAQENVTTQTLRYSVIDMSAAGNLGDIATPASSNMNLSLKTAVSEKLTAIKDAAGTGFWVVAHGYDKPTSAVNSEFYAYHVLPTTGLNTTPVISSGSPHDSTAVPTKVPSAGQMKISPDGTKIACAVAAGFVEILNFNTTTGAVTGPARTTLANPQSTSPFNHNSLYGLEFSPDSKVLYVSTLLSPGNIFQLDLSNSSSNWTHVATGTAATSGAYDIAQLQLGPDHNIYVARDGSTKIGVITSPNTVGGAVYNPNGPSLPSGNSRLGLPAVIGGDFSCAATAACATITEPTVRCDQGVFTYSFTLTNNSTTQTIQNLLLSPPLGAHYSVSPTVKHLTPPLQPGGHTVVTGTITNASPGDHVCINVVLADENFVSCCTVQVCFDLPSCPCLRLMDRALSCVNGANTYNISVQNLTGVQLQQIFVVPISPANLIMTPSVFPGPVQANGIAHLTFTITGAPAGTDVCFRLVPTGVESLCCPSERICVKLLNCVPPPATQKTKKSKQ